jgi:DNA modification methylase
LTATTSASPDQGWRLNDLSGRDWIKGTKSFLFQRGLGAAHVETKYERLHPGTFSYQDAEGLIRFFTKAEQRVLDPMMGVASTLKACVLSGRYGVGIELSQKYCGWGEERLQEELDAEQLAAFPQRIICGDAREECPKLSDDDFHFILTSPPYWNILSKTPDTKAKASSALRNGTLAYSDDPRDFGCIEEYEVFLQEYASLVVSWRRLVRPRRYMAIIVADFRHGERLYPLHADLIQAIQRHHPVEGRRLVLQGIKVLAQNQKKLYPYGYPYAYVPNIHHHYVLIYRNLER